MVCPGRLLHSETRNTCRNSAMPVKRNKKRSCSETVSCLWEMVGVETFGSDSENGEFGFTFSSCPVMCTEVAVYHTGSPLALPLPGCCSLGQGHQGSRQGQGGQRLSPMCCAECLDKCKYFMQQFCSDAAPPVPSTEHAGEECACCCETANFRIFRPWQIEIGSFQKSGSKHWCFSPAQLCSGGGGTTDNK